MGGWGGQRVEGRGREKVTKNIASKIKNKKRLYKFAPTACVGPDLMTECIKGEWKDESPEKMWWLVYYVIRLWLLGELYF